MNGSTALDPATTIGSGRLEHAGFAARALGAAAAIAASAAASWNVILMTCSSFGYRSARYGSDLSRPTSFGDRTATDRDAISPCDRFAPVNARPRDERAVFHSYC